MISNLALNRIEGGRFVRLAFGLTLSFIISFKTFILEGISKEHFISYKSVYSEPNEKVRNYMYVDDLVSRENILSEVEIIR